MKKNVFNILNLFIPIVILAAGFSACADTGKSELVKRLEAIFYDPDFAKIPDVHFNAGDYGAVGDGKTLNTEAIQDAIDAAFEAGGGVVSFPQGVYMSGSIFIKSNIEFRIDEGVTIKAIQDDSQYPEIWGRVAGVEMYWPAALININEQKNVRITGKGTIDGNGKYWWDKFWGDPPLSGGMYTDYIARGLRWAVDYDCKRIRAVVASKSEDLVLRDFTVNRSGFWTVTLTYCNRVHVDGVIVRNNIDGYGPSSDGINTDSSSDILLENCDVDCNDDNYCLKAGMNWDGQRVNRPTENIVYRNSIARSGHGLITLGSDAAGGIHNVEVYGLKGLGTNMGIRFKSARVRGGVMEDIHFHHMEMDGVEFPFHFELNWYPSFSYPTLPEDIPKDSIPEHWITITNPVLPPEKGIPTFRNLRFNDIRVKNAGQAFHVNAYEERPMSNISWKNISIEAEKAGEINHALDWTMENVTLSIQDNEKIALTNAVNFQHPEYVFKDSLKAEKKEVFVDLDDLLSSSEDSENMIAIDENNVLISRGDTLFSKKITLVIRPDKTNEFRFFEPWGDGVLFSPVNINFSAAGKHLMVAGEQEHDWIIYLRTNVKPVAVNGADNWEYFPETKRLMLEKTGSRFTITY